MSQVQSAKIRKTIAIVGGGFGGVRAALDLARRAGTQHDIVLLSDKPHFEYTPTLYKVVTGGSALEVCIPLATIFRDLPVRLVEARVTDIDLSQRTIKCESGYTTTYDYLVLALGSETAYFNIPGLSDLSFSFKSTYEALQLKKHLEGVFASAAQTKTADDKVSLGHIVIVGAGASGTELAGEMAEYARCLAKKYSVDPGLVTIDLFEGAPRVLPLLPPEVSERVKQRLHELGINVFLNRVLMKEEVDGVFLKDMQLKTKTVIWTAGVKPNALVAKIAGLSLDKRGKVVVNEFLQPPGFTNVFIVGDIAATEFSGMAQTAMAAGAYVARAILSPRTIKPFKPKKPAYSIPVGPSWAATIFGPLTLYGYAGWILRRAADLRYFTTILSPWQALTAFRNGKKLACDCKTCQAVLVPDALTQSK